MKTKIQQLWTDNVRTAVIAAMICGTITHLFALVNVLHNYDDIAQQPYGYGTGITSGRWFLTILGDFCQKWGGNYNLHFVNGMLFILLIAISAGFLVSALQIRGKVTSALIGMLFVVFPTATSTLHFRYTAVYYGLAILLAVVAAWVLRYKKFGILISALCTALSLGIYQAYVPFTISILVLMLLRQTMEGETDFKGLFARGIYYCAALALGLVAYFLFLKLFLALYGTALSNYQGVGEMGKLALSDIPGLVKKAAYCVCILPFTDYCGLNNMQLVKNIYLLIAAFSGIMMAYTLFVKIRKVSIVVMTGLLCAAFVVAVGFVEIMCPDTWIYTLMVYSFVTVACLPLVLMECLPEKENFTARVNPILQKAITLIAAVLICCYAYEANIAYSYTYFATRQMENYMTAMVAQVRMTEGFDTDKKWVYIGAVEDALLDCYWQYDERYGGMEFTPWLLNRYSRYAWLQNYVGYLPPAASDEEIEALAALDEVKEMPSWPNYGSIKVIGDAVVIKFNDPVDGVITVK